MRIIAGLREVAPREHVRFKLMKGYGRWLQLSVFQCRLRAQRRAELARRDPQASYYCNLSRVRAERMSQAARAVRIATNPLANWIVAGQSRQLSMARWRLHADEAHHSINGRAWDATISTGS
jgi:hypothetical protein